MREAFWSWQLALNELVVAKERLKNAQIIAADVSRRVKAGDLARADQHQADGNVAAAVGSVAESELAAANAQLPLRILIGFTPSISSTIAVDQLSERLPTLPKNSESPIAPYHPELVALNLQSEVAKQSARLAALQNRSNSELTVGINRERGAFGEAYQNKVSLGIRIPLGSQSRNTAKAAVANAEALEIDIQMRLTKERLTVQLELAKQKVLIATQALESSLNRARIANETRGFFDKSFRLGETDLPTRLRVELESFEAARQVSRAQIELAASISSLQQALGLLPQRSNEQQGKL